VPTICHGWIGAAAETRSFPVRLSGRAQAQRSLMAALVAAGTLLSCYGSAMAQFRSDRQAQWQAECELSAIRDTRSPIAIQSIRSACNWLAINGDSLLNEGGKNYRLCLVQQLSGVQADQAAEAIACRTAYPP